MQRESFNYDDIAKCSNYSMLDRKAYAINYELYIIPMFLNGELDPFLQWESLNYVGFVIHWNEVTEAMYAQAKRFLQRESFHYRTLTFIVLVSYYI